MLRRRARGVSSSQGLMSNHSSLPSPTPKCNSPRASSSLFASPRLSVGLSPECPSDFEAAMSPTSILESKTSSFIANPFFNDQNLRKPLLEPATATTETRQHPWDNGDFRAIGLGIVDALKNDGVGENPSKPNSPMVLFGSQLRIQIPNSIAPTGFFESPRSPIEFGIKNKTSQLALLSPIGRSPMVSGSFGSEVMASSPRVVTGRLSESELELSRTEDYTCVISRGPNPRTTHIFDSCDIECCGNGFNAPMTKNGSSGDRTGYHSDDPLSSCHVCKQHLGHGEGHFCAQRQEKAFSSGECQC